MPITGCTRLRQQSAFLASMLLDALEVGDEASLTSALQMIDRLRVESESEPLDPVSAERFELLDAVAADVSTRRNQEVHTRLLRHLAHALLESTPASPAAG